VVYGIGVDIIEPSGDPWVLHNESKLEWVRRKNRGGAGGLNT